MSLARSLAFAGCLAALVSGGCYRAADKADGKGASGTAAPKTAATSTAPPPQVVVHGTEIPDDRNSKALQMVTIQQLRDEQRKRDEASAVEAAKVAQHLKPGASGTATPTGTAASPALTGTAVAAATPQPSSSPSATPSATSSGTQPAGTKSAVAVDPYVRPAMQRDSSQVAVEVRPSRSPQPKKLPPVDRTKVLAAPQTTGGTLGITFDNLMFDMKPTDIFDPKMINDSVRALFGKKVKLRGYIHPASVMVEKGFTQFIFVRDDQACCFGPGALLYDNVVVKMKPGKTANFSVLPIAVEGVMSFQETGKFGNQPASVFRIDADSAE